MLKKKQKNSFKFSKGLLITIAAIAGISVLVGGFLINSFTAVNSDSLVFAPTTNVFLKALKSSQGYHYSTQSTKGSKTVPSAAGTSPSIVVSKGNLVQIHLINEEKNQPDMPSRHNLNIDEFNVHLKDLGYFQTDSVKFLADKTGTFHYYCSVHPDMKGTITVTDSLLN
jgi:hypothetical protein